MLDNPDTYSIVVGGLETTDNCFIAMPFCDEFKDLFHIIENAITRTNFDLQIKRSDFHNNNPIFIKGIIDFIRSAKLIISVISTDNRFGTTNPNVMLELGMAYALGKSVVVLVDERNFKNNDIPVDLDRIKLLKYTQDEIQNGNLEEKIINKVSEIISDMEKHKKRLIFPKWEDYNINEYKVSKKFMHYPEFQSCLCKIFSILNRLSEEFNNVKSLSKALRDYSNKITSISNIREKGSTIDDFNTQYNSYINNYNRNTKFLFNEKEKILHGLLECLNFINDNFFNVDNESECINDLSKALNKYLQYHEELENMLNRDNLINEEEDFFIKICTYTWSLDQSIKNIIVGINGLNKNLIEIIISYGLGGMNEKSNRNNNRKT